MTGRAALAGCLAGLGASAAHAAPSFTHVVIIVQENRTPDNLFGSNPRFEPGVDVATSGMNSKGKIVPLTPVALANCYDIGHAHKSFVASFTKGADQDPASGQGCQIPSNPQFKYVDNSSGTVQPYFDIATNWGFANRMFQTNQGPSLPAHQLLFGGTSAPSADTPLLVAENPGNGYNSLTGCAVSGAQSVSVIDQYGSETSNPAVAPCFERPTLSDLLDQAGLSWRYYAPVATGIWLAPNAIAHICNAQGAGKARSCTGSEWTTHVVPNNSAQILTDIQNCALANVSWVIPTCAESDHAACNQGLGPAWVATIVNAIGAQTCGTESYWQDTAIIVTWDDWGGWYDHVSPPQVTNPYNWGAAYTFGFRVPLLVVSAYTPPGTVIDDQLDFGSILYWTEQNFGLGFIGAGYDTYTNYADYWAQYEGSLASFFSLDTPQPFTPVNTQADRSLVVEQARHGAGPDND